MELSHLSSAVLFIHLSIAAQAATLDTAAQKELLEFAQTWGVPQPSAQAKLVQISAFRSGDVNQYALGFVERGKKDQALVGFAQWDLTRHNYAYAPDPNAIALEHITPTSPFSEVYGVNFGLITGIQLIRRGDQRLGLALIEKALGADAGHSRSPFHSPAGEPPIIMLARSCLAAALNEITSDKPDFANIKRRIERLLADEPKLRSEATDWVLQSLAENVAHEPSPPGSTDAVIDNFLLCRRTNGLFSLNVGDFPPGERALILKGFEAVPALLRQRHSKRFTNHVMQGFNNFTSYPMNAGQVIDAYLQRLANEDFESTWLDRQQGYTLSDAALTEWWKAASTLGEEAYVKTNAVRIGANDEVRISQELLLIAQVRYPNLLPGFYSGLLKTSEQSWAVAQTLADSRAISREQKIELFQEAIATQHEAHRNWALKHLQSLDPPLADELLIQLLEKAPNNPQGEYWHDEDGHLGAFVSKSRDRRVWQALHALLDRADLGMRMELIHHLSPPYDAPDEILQSFQAIYLRFYDDKTVRDVSTDSRLSGPGAGFPHNRIELRDFVHVHWAKWLKLGLKEPGKGASPAQWQVYRDAVREALEKHSSSNDLKVSDQPQK